MPSGNFRSTPISSIVVDRGNRQRSALLNIDELAESIHRIGLINPIVVTGDGVLVAGERRLTAVQRLGWTHISTQLVDDLSEHELAIIELEENVKRDELPWADRCRAIAKFHELKRQDNAEWTQAQTALALGTSDADVTRQLSVAEAFTTNPALAQSATFSVAHNLVAREAERKRTSMLSNISFVSPRTAELLGDAAEQLEPRITQVVERRTPLILADFHEWAASYSGDPFNLIHCDFPYGINVTAGSRQNSSIQETYDDSPDTYWSLINTLGGAMSNVVADSSHLIFWFSMHFYEETKQQLSAMGWTVSPFPLIWHKSDNAGVAPDPQRQPRRTYETAFFCSRGDRKLTQAGAKANSFAWPGGQKEIHLSEKPVPMLKHFMSLVCDEYSTVLDPTCGSGNALKAASALGAHSVLGLEKDEGFYATAVARYWGEEDA